MTAERQIETFGEILETHMARLGYHGQTVGNYSEDDKIIFKFRLQADLEKTYQRIESDWEKICVEMYADDIGLRMWGENLEMRFSRRDVMFLD
jgi:hypothetical protein